MRKPSKSHAVLSKARIGTAQNMISKGDDYDAGMRELTHVIIYATQNNDINTLFLAMYHLASCHFTCYKLNGDPEMKNHHFAEFKNVALSLLNDKRFANKDCLHHVYEGRDKTYLQSVSLMIEEVEKIQDYLRK